MGSKSSPKAAVQEPLTQFESEQARLQGGKPLNQAVVSRRATIRVLVDGTSVVGLAHAHIPVAESSAHVLHAHAQFLRLHC